MKRHAPATGRNRDPISAVLTEELPDTGVVLEIASGSGEHAVHFARTYPDLAWQPSDPDEASRASIEVWRIESGLANLRPAITLDAASEGWPVGRADAIVCINMTHISKPAATEGLFAAAGRLLHEGAPLIIYGPFKEAGVDTAASNLAFDADLKARDPAWGLREREWLDALALINGLKLTRRVAMPANNLALVYRKT